LPIVSLIFSGPFTLKFLSFAKFIIGYFLQQCMSAWRKQNKTVFNIYFGFVFHYMYAFLLLFVYLRQFELVDFTINNVEICLFHNGGFYCFFLLYGAPVFYMILHDKWNIQ
jgi:hypothetical protein